MKWHLQSIYCYDIDSREKEKCVFIHAVNSFKDYRKYTVMILMELIDNF